MLFCEAKPKSRLNLISKERAIHCHDLDGSYENSAIQPPTNAAPKFMNRIMSVSYVVKKDIEHLPGESQDCLTKETTSVYSPSEVSPEGKQNEKTSKGMCDIQADERSSKEITSTIKSKVGKTDYKLRSTHLLHLDNPSRIPVVSQRPKPDINIQKSLPEYAYGATYLKAVLNKQIDDPVLISTKEFLNAVHRQKKKFSPILKKPNFDPDTKLSNPDRPLSSLRKVKFCKNMVVIEYSIDRN